MEDQIRVIDARTLRIEQTMATKDDLKAYATKADLKAEIDLAVDAMQQEMAGLAERSDRIEARLATVATKQHVDDAVSKLATKVELAEAVSRLATKEELRGLEQRLGESIAGLEERVGQSIAGLGDQIASLKPRKARKH